jgi:hypothetical protein
VQKQAAMDSVRSNLKQLGTHPVPADVVTACAPGVIAGALREAQDLAEACGRGYLGLAQEALIAKEPGKAQQHLANLRAFTGFSSPDVTAAEVALRKLDAERTEAARLATAQQSLAGKWSYAVSEDPMTSRKSRTARIQSENAVNFGFPYQGEQHATLMLRDHPSYGRDVIVKIEQGQFLCQSYSDCQVRVRFDENNPERWSAVGPSDNSTTTLFIRNEARFIQKMRKARIVRIQVPIYQEGEPMFEFHVSGFQLDRYQEGR